MEENTLIELGLSQSESKIYLTLLEQGFCNVTTIINKSKVSKSSFYQALERLQEKGLVSHSKVDETNYYEAEHPEKLLLLLRQKEDSLKAILPQLLLKHSMSDKADVKIMTGTSSLKHALQEACVHNG